jgi:hypothetical protein
MVRTTEEKVLNPGRETQTFSIRHLEERSKVMRSKLSTTLVIAPLLAIAPAALANTTWYVNGVRGSDSNNCKSPTTACKTIKHAISLAVSGDSIMLAPATYIENLNISTALKIQGSGANAIILPKNANLPVVQVATHVVLSKLTISRGQNSGVLNSGTLTMNDCIVTHNAGQRHSGFTFGGGIYNIGTLTINNSMISANVATAGGGIYSNSRGTAAINSSTLTGNGGAVGGGIFSDSPLVITNSTITGNVADVGGGLTAAGTTVISSSTISGNSAERGGGIANAVVTFRNSIVANNNGGNCYNSAPTSKGYNLSSDDTCNFNEAGDMNNTNPVLGPLGNYGGPTYTIPLLSGSPAIDAGNPSGCTDGQGRVLKTDQRGKPRPDLEDAGGCDIGAYERQTD